MLMTRGRGTVVTEFSHLSSASRMLRSWPSFSLEFRALAVGSSSSRGKRETFVSKYFRLNEWEVSEYIDRKRWENRVCKLQVGKGTF
jgi:hypothetical protein